MMVLRLAVDRQPPSRASACALKVFNRTISANVWEGTMATWKQCITGFPGNFKGIQDRFDAIFMALVAPKEMALFSRTSEDFEHEIFLLTPAAARLADQLEGDWVDVSDEDVKRHKWTLLVAATDVEAQFGITLGQD
jgi:hypothetical protein